MEQIYEKFKKTKRPERVIQFGEGGFLRGFVDWMLQKMNESGLYDGSVVVVQPIEQGLCEKLSAQQCMYTHIMRGLEKGVPVVKKDVIDVISRCVNPYTEYEAYLALAKNPELQVIVSNTTEAGITYRPEDRLTDQPLKSFPAKLTALLYERYKNGLPGFILLPCELIDRNGEKLKEIVLRYGADWNLGQQFATWLETENEFCCTLVDRIVTGRPVEDMGLEYADEMANTSELFHLWAIEGKEALGAELPFAAAGLNVVWTKNLEAYRTRKVRILNGAHTAMVPYAMLRGFETVKSCMDDPDMREYVRRCVFEEIIPTLDSPVEELKAYADQVLERFANPYLHHALSSIALNSVSKFKVRVLPSILEYRRRMGKNPQTLLQSFAALLRFYKTDMVKDDPEIAGFMKQADTRTILGEERLWGQDLSFLYEEVARYE